MTASGPATRATPRCTLCPAGCPVEMKPSGPDTWRAEPPLARQTGLCPRGAALGELLGHRRRMVDSSVTDARGPSATDFATAVRTALDAAGERPRRIVLDGALSCEQIREAATWVAGWDGARLCLLIEPAEHELLLGLEAGGAESIADDALSACDGFVIVGDAFAANPACSRGVFDRRREQPRTPIVVLDAASGTAAKFATHRLTVRPGAEAGALAALASAAGAAVEAYRPDGDVPGAKAAGAALSGCERLGVLIAAEYGRGGQWRQAGYVAAVLAGHLGGGVAAQTNAANALAAVRLGARLDAVPPSDALGAAAVFCIACDPLGMLGASSPEPVLAAAGLGNRTADAARVVVPTTLPGETGGTFLLSGARKVEIAPLLAAPAGVPTPAEVVARIAEADGASRADVPSLDELLGPLNVDAPEPAATPPPADETVLLLGRTAMHAGAGPLTAHASWQQAMEPLPEVRVAPDDAAAMSVANLQTVTVQTPAGACRARVRVAPELASGAVVLADGAAERRALLSAGTGAPAVTLSIAKAS